MPCSFLSGLSGLSAPGLRPWPGASGAGLDGVRESPKFAGRDVLRDEEDGGRALPGFCQLFPFGGRGCAMWPDTGGRGRGGRMCAGGGRHVCVRMKLGGSGRCIGRHAG